jgi:hypothetical protein
VLLSRAVPIVIAAPMNVAVAAFMSLISLIKAAAPARPRLVSKVWS